MLFYMTNRWICFTSLFLYIKTWSKEVRPWVSSNKVCLDQNLKFLSEEYWVRKLKPLKINSKFMSCVLLQSFINNSFFLKEIFVFG
jgi:hypothetical protein